MKINKKWLIIAVMIALPIIVWKIAYPTYSYNFRLTVEINTPDGIKSGSSVLNVKTTEFPRWTTLGAYDSHTSIKGEGIFIDLGQGKNLVVVLGHGPGIGVHQLTRFVPRAFMEICNACSYNPEWTRLLSHMEEKKSDLIARSVPTMVTFSNLDSPESAAIVYTSRVFSHLSDANYAAGQEDVVVTDKFAEIFGEGYTFNRAWVEVIDDRVTSGISKKISWLNSSYRTTCINMTDRGKRGNDGKMGANGKDFYCIPRGVFIHDHDN